MRIRLLRARDPDPASKRRRTGAVAYVAETRPLFPRGRPHVDEVVQGALGDCYLLVALKAMLLSPFGPAILARQVREHGAEVTVRFYNLVAKRVEAVDVTVDRTVPIRNGAPLNARSAPWVVFLEKAYAAFREQIVNGHDSLLDIDDVTTGLSEEAYFHLSGIATTSITVRGPAPLHLRTGRRRGVVQPEP